MLDPEAASPYRSVRRHGIRANSFAPGRDGSVGAREGVFFFFHYLLLWGG